MNWVEILTREITPVLGTLILLIFIADNTKMEQHDKRSFLVIIALELIEVLAYEAELVFADLPYPTFWRVLLSVIGYSIRPAIVFMFVKLTIQDSISRFRQVFIYIPLTVNFAVACTGFFSDISFSYSETNVFHRGPLGYTVYYTTLLYLAILLIADFRNSRKHTEIETRSLLAINAYFVISMIGWYASDENFSIFRYSFVVCTILYYLMFQNNIIFSMIDDVPVAIVKYRIKGGVCKLVSFNDTMCDMLDISREEYEYAIKHEELPGLNTESKHMLKDEISKVAACDNYEFQIKADLAGSEKWFRITAKAICRNANETNAYAVIADITTEKIQEKELSHRAEYDLMTGIFNRGTTEKAIRQALADTHGVSCALLVIDIDSLKGINDTFGHAVGDEVIINIASALKAHFRETDIVGRLGGDEYAVFMNSVGEKSDISVIIDTMMNSISSFIIGNGSIVLSVSIGIAMGVTGSANDLETLYNEADSALYRIKKNGKSGYAFYKHDN